MPKIHAIDEIGALTICVRLLQGGGIRYYRGGFDTADITKILNTTPYKARRLMKDGAAEGSWDLRSGGSGGGGPGKNPDYITLNSDAVLGALQLMSFCEAPTPLYNLKRQIPRSAIVEAAIEATMTFDTSQLPALSRQFGIHLSI